MSADENRDDALAMDGEDASCWKRVEYIHDAWVLAQQEATPPPLKRLLLACYRRGLLDGLGDDA